MPIRPENRDRYPADWKAIRERILRRAGHRCEWPGCNAYHRSAGYWRADRFVPMPRVLSEAGAKVGDEIACADGSTIEIIMIVLTIAHLDHQPENCDPANLRAWCQRHHLRYDAEHHAQTAYRTRRAGRAIGDLFP